MPYCSVEEAWGKNFQKMVKPPKELHHHVQRYVIIKLKKVS